MRLSREEKEEMLEDAKSDRRREEFRAGRKNRTILSMDEYISFLDSVQKIFSPFKISFRPTPTALNKL